MSRVVSQRMLAGLLALTLPVMTAEALPIDCQQAHCIVHAEVDVECPCGEAPNHGRYLACVTRVVNRAVREGRMPRECRNKVNGCFIRSLCGKRERTVLCDLPGDGPSGRCRPLLSDDHCRARGGEVVSSCCPSCGDATPTPTVSLPSPTRTPGGPVPTVTGPAPTATPLATTTAAATPLATSTGVPATETPAATFTTVPATETPAATTTAVPATETPTATTTAAPPTATPTLAGTVTPGVPTITAEVTPIVVPTATIVAPSPTEPLPSTTPSAIASPTPTATPAAPLIVLVDGEPDTGAPPLAVQLASDVSGGKPPYSYTWTFGDGSATSSDPNPLHVYQRIGDFTATLVVQDAAGDEDSDEIDVTVESP